MAGPWEKYQNQASGPWTKYAQPGAQPADPTDLSNVPGAIPGMQTPQQAAGVKTPKLHGTSIDYGKLLDVGDFATGAVKGLAHTSNLIDEQFMGPPTADNPLWVKTSNMATPEQQQQRLTPQNNAQKLGYGAEQVGEFLVPGGAEKRLSGELAGMAPKLGKAAAPVARIAAGALSTGAVNKAQGGDFSTGALMGAGGGALSEGFRTVAPMVAESALGVRNVDRRAPITPGNSILKETTGINARKIADQATGKQSLYTAQRDALLSNAPPVDLTPARQVAQDAQATAALRNNADTIRRTGQLSDLLHIENATPPNPMRAGAAVKSAAAIPPQVSATRANSLKAGLGDLKNSWNPATPNEFADAAVGRTYGTLDKTIDAAAPGTSKLNDQISALFPVANRANATDLNAGVMQRVMNRVTRPTGALFTAGLGASEGYHKGGAAGAVAGAGLGLVAPEIIGSPTAQMIMARGMSQGATPVVRTLLGGGLQSTRQPSLYRK